ncbi:MAG TPA: TetR/AcrR family transcriptional regulator [Epsilonproteobacteria bacterium]|nr:TetR/AcrR family transcriptional regulator [Campylobacterota bacterium]
MPIIVNREEKRRAIALACKEVLLKHGIKEITISKIAQTAGVGKGTIYEYFNNKEDIVFEIISAFISEHEQELLMIRREQRPIREKVFRMLCSMYQDAYHQKQLMLYREYLAISLTSEVEEMQAFSQACRNRFLTLIRDLFTEGVKRGELRPEAVGLAEMFHSYGLGIVVESHSTGQDPIALIEQMVSHLFEVMENKEQVCE